MPLALEPQCILIGEKHQYERFKKHRNYEKDNYITFCCVDVFRTHRKGADNDYL